MTHHSSSIYRIIWLHLIFPSHLCLFQVERLRRELSEVEESRDSGRKELIEAHRELRECLQDRDTQRREGLELKRALGDVVREKEAIQASNHELRTAVKRAEFENNRFSILDLFEMLIPFVLHTCPLLAWLCNIRSTLRCDFK